MAKKVRLFTEMGIRAKADLVRALTLLGEDAMFYAFEKGYSSVPRSSTSQKYKKGDTKAWTDVSKNLRDSFASAVYIDGVLQPETIRYVNDSPTSKHGRDVVDRYLYRIHPQAGTGQVSVVVVAAMQYTQYLESGRHRGGYKIKVVSSARDYIDRYWWSYVDGIYTRFSISKPKVRVVRGDIHDDLYSDYVPRQM